MAKPDKLKVVSKLGTLDPATTAQVAEALSSEMDSERVDNALKAAERHGLIEPQAPDSDSGSPSWSVTEKGERKAASAASG